MKTKLRTAGEMPKSNDGIVPRMNEGKFAGW